MNNHECVIGIMYDYENTELMTINNLKSHIKEVIELNEFARNDPIYSKLECYQKEYTIRDYADKRKRTNFRRFEYCPDCGKQIDWKKIKENENALMA